MDPRQEKRAAFKAARELLANGEEAGLRYCALELRRCLEAVVYEKLSAYKNRLPAQARKWQPPQAFKALQQFEPDAASSATISLALEEKPGGPPQGPFQVLGQDLRPKIDWLTKTWNKLGSFLHADFPFSGQKPDISTASGYFGEVLEDLRPFVERSFTSTFGLTVRITCQFCGFETVANADGVKARGELICLNPDCSVRYRALGFTGDEAAFEPDVPILECLNCGKCFHLIPRQLVDRGIVKCSSCKTEHMVRQAWQYGLLSASDESNSKSDGGDLGANK